DRSRDFGRRNKKRIEKPAVLGLVLMAFLAEAAHGAGVGQREVFETSFETAKPHTNAFVDVEKEPIQPHPDNPHYLLWRGRPAVLITSGEHYGAVMNTPFDYVAYLDELQSVGLNLTRLFSGVYCEAVGDFDIKSNTLAPGPRHLLCPFARSNTPGYANGGNKFDLTQWDEAYFVRLKDFVAQAGKRGIAVEFSFFCPYYTGSQWNLSPLNPSNNINNMEVAVVSATNGAWWKDAHTVLCQPVFLSVQQALVRKVVTELKGADNVYYEVCNEAYGVSSEWQHEIANTIVETEKALSCKHLIAQNTSPVYGAVHPAVSIFNFHPGAVNVDVRAHYGLNKLTGLDETSPLGKPVGAATTAFDYRRWGWTHLLDGGAIYNNLDYSFTVPSPQGKGVNTPWVAKPGEAMTDVRQQLRILKDFIEGFDFIRMKPCQNGIALAPSAAGDKKSRILIQWNEQAWESLNFPIRPDGTQGDSWHGDGLVLARKIAGTEGKRTGAAADPKGIVPATAAAEVSNLIGRWEVEVNRSFKTVWTFHEDGTVESTAGGVRSARWKAAAKRTSPAVSLYALAEPGRQYAIYLHGGKQATLMLSVPEGRYRAEWISTLTGKVDKSEEVTHGGGVLTLSSPEYTDDVALRVKERSTNKREGNSNSPARCGDDDKKMRKL
ncbi:MAG: DUF6298 domain-containing protein, partial [bacterium]